MILESAGGGSDEIWSFVDFTLTDNVEVLMLLGNALSGGGNLGNNTVVGNVRDNFLTGNGGKDTFVLGSGFGRDTVTDFAAGTDVDDVIHIRDGLFAGFADVMAHAAQVGANVVITLDSENSLTLDGVSLADLHANDFLLT